jgi:hypothetical protein
MPTTPTKFSRSKQAVGLGLLNQRAWFDSKRENKIYFSFY